jgi:hypothetical protein
MKDAVPFDRAEHQGLHESSSTTKLEGWLGRSRDASCEECRANIGIAVTATWLDM